MDNNVVALEKLWQRLLDVTEVAAADNFFEQGGDSLLALEMATTFEESTGSPFPLDVLFSDGGFGAMCVAVSEPAAVNGQV
ncbi:phosphopantetheine-binding protein [Kribbella sp. NBC_00382]|uniref:phosphopantetheine-binding protein n=1 Tax=Kribbella sp. NBC_00382 TaxID=2975967 RepID=UPI002E243F9C